MLKRSCILVLSFVVLVAIHPSMSMANGTPPEGDPVTAPSIHQNGTPPEGDPVTSSTLYSEDSSAGASMSGERAVIDDPIFSFNTLLMGGMRLVIRMVGAAL